MASIMLGKDQAINLTKEAGGFLREVMVGLGWQAAETGDVDFDLDAWAVGLGADGQIADGNPEWVVFYSSALRTRDEQTTYYGKWNDGGMPCAPKLAVVHTGDNLTGGSGANDDEAIKVHLDRVPREVVKIVFPVTIFKAAQRHQKFGMVRTAFVRTVDASTNRELTRFNLSGEADDETIVIFGELYRVPEDPSEWAFRAVEAAWQQGVSELMASWGIETRGQG